MASHTSPKQSALLALNLAKYALRSSANRAQKGFYAAIPRVHPRLWISMESRQKCHPFPFLCSPGYTTLIYVVSYLKIAMHFVYIIVSVSYPDRYYVGLTENVRQRLGQHNQGIVRSTASFKPWRLRTAVCFSSRARAAEFESYLKTGSGIAFLRRRFL